MKKIKIIGIFFFICLSLVLLRRCFPKDSEHEEKITKVIPFKKLTEIQQRDSIIGFINHENYKDRYFLLNENLKEGLKNSVKYPETLEYYYQNEWVDGKSTYVIDEKKISQSSENFKELTATVDFRSENNFGVKVRNKFKIIFEFNGAEPYKIIEANILN